jgi:hypothetical protein
MQKECFSHLAEREQLGHIASEISRARGWAQKAYISRRDAAVGRAVELIDRALASASPCSLVSREDLAAWRTRLSQVSSDEGLLADVEERLLKILTGAPGR